MVDKTKTVDAPILLINKMNNTQGEQKVIFTVNTHLSLLTNNQLNEIFYVFGFCKKYSEKCNLNIKAIEC